MTEDLIKPYVFRILNGAMAGCEFRVTTERALLIVGNDESEKVISPFSDLPSDTFFIPGNAISSNVEFFVKSSEKRTLLAKTVNCDKNDEFIVIFNKIYTINGFTFAVKEEEDRWLDDVLGVPPVTEPEPLFNTSKKIIVLISFLLLIGCGFMFYYEKYDDPQRKLNLILYNNGKNYQIIKGGDGVFYIFVENERASLWVAQTMTRSGFNDPTKIFYPLQESYRIRQWVATHYGSLRFIRLQLDNPLQPVIVVSLRDIYKTKESLEKLKSDALTLMPYSSKVIINAVNNEFVIKEAKEGLSAIGLLYNFNEGESQASFVIRGNLNDAQLQRLQTFLTNFYQLWGRELVYFNVELEDDLFKNNSVSYGQLPYVKDGSTHWSFN
ncbi:PrgH/EprH family type III secretion apparatus protein [Salmonella enterica]|nr:PrgH/EprH family type III secretion apparatus protein [Salmonella enterica]